MKQHLAPVYRNVEDTLPALVQKVLRKFVGDFGSDSACLLGGFCAYQMGLTTTYHDFDIFVFCPDEDAINRSIIYLTEELEFQYSGGGDYGPSMQVYKKIDDDVNEVDVILLKNTNVSEWVKVFDIDLARCAGFLPEALGTQVIFRDLRLSFQSPIVEARRRYQAWGVDEGEVWVMLEKRRVLAQNKLNEVTRMMKYLLRTSNEEEVRGELVEM